MDHLTFELACKNDGFETVEEKHGAPGFTSKLHTHPFAARILVLTGEFRITRNGEMEVYHSGGSFTMESGCEHAESFGPDGASYLVSRKHDAPHA